MADLGGGVRDARPPLGVQILSISCSFRENLACSRPPSGKSWIRHWVDPGEGGKSMKHLQCPSFVINFTVPLGPSTGPPSVWVYSAIHKAKGCVLQTAADRKVLQRPFSYPHF